MMGNEFGLFFCECLTLPLVPKERNLFIIFIGYNSMCVYRNIRVTEI